MRLLICLMALVAFEASAQRFGRERGGGPRDPSPQETRTARAAVPGDPYAALDRELSSLKVDLQVRGEQRAAWQAFERDVRDIAEIARQRTLFLMSLREPGDKPLPTAADVLARLAEEDRRRSDLAAEARRHFDALYAILDEAQRRMADRRIVLSQTEPLGQEASPKR